MVYLQFGRVGRRLPLVANQRPIQGQCKMMLLCYAVMAILLSGSTIFRLIGCWSSQASFCGLGHRSEKSPSTRGQRHLLL